MKEIVVDLDGSLSLADTSQYESALVNIDWNAQD